MPSRVEPFGTVAAESMAAMRCTVVSNVQGLVEIVEDGVSGLVVEAEDATQWADAVQSLTADPAWADQLARVGHQMVTTRFSAEAYSDAMVAAVRELSHGATRRFVQTAQTRTQARTQTSTQPPPESQTRAQAQPRAQASSKGARRP